MVLKRHSSLNYDQITVYNNSERLCDESYLASEGVCDVAELCLQFACYFELGYHCLLK